MEALGSIVQINSQMMLLPLIWEPQTENSLLQPICPNDIFIFRTLHTQTIKCLLSIISRIYMVFLGGVDYIVDIVSSAEELFLGLLGTDSERCPGYHIYG